MMRRFDPVALAGGLWFVLVALYLLMPIAIVIPLSFSPSDFLQFPPEGLSLRWYRAFLGDPLWLESTARSLRIALAATAIATATSTAAALWLARGAGRGAGTVNGLLMSPAIIPNVVIALGVFILATRLGLPKGEALLALAHAALGLPFVLLIIGGALRQVDTTPELAARVFGAGPVRAFAVTTLRALLPAVASAAIFAFFVSFDEMVIALFVGGGTMTLPVRIWSDLHYEINPTVAAVASLLVMLNVAFLLLAEILRRSAMRGRGKG